MSITHHPLSPLALVTLAWSRRHLIAQLVKRESLGRYRGAALGVVWSVLNPLAMLAVFTFVFSEVFKARWPGAGAAGDGALGRGEFALVLFAGLAVFNVFAECLQRASALIVGNPAYVKKIVFPLEVLPIVSVLSALVHFAISVVLLLLVQWVFWGRVPATIPLVLVVMLPLLLQILGITWAIAALAVYFRDIGQSIGLLTTALMFLSPIFFPSDALPADWRFITSVNPLAFPIEATRRVLLWSQSPDWSAWAINLALSALIAWGGLAFFQKSRRGFPDVL